MLLYTIGLIAAVVFFGLKYIYSYWDRHGLPNLKPEIPYGNLRALAQKKEGFNVTVNKLYERSSERLVGVYLFFRPAILIRDAHLAKRIMVNDFQSFHDRGVYCNEHGDPMSANLFALPGQRWKNLRGKLTPTFTSGQLRLMLPTFLTEGNKLQSYLELLADEGKIVDMRDVLSRYVLDVVASVFFGFEANCLHNPSDAFRTALLDLNNAESFFSNIRTTGIFICPALLKYTGISSLSPPVKKFTTEVISSHLHQRESNQITRKDFIQMLTDLRRKAGSNVQESLTDAQCAANVFLFYAAGADTSTGTISFTLHELTHKPEVMAKLQREVDEMLEQHGGEITYDNIKEMKYLDLCVKETLRLYPSLAILNRECTEDYRVPDSDVVIRKGTQVIIPLLGISMDEKYFPEPESYSPERFDEGTKNYDPDAYYPFGAGPRNCIGLRQGILLSKIALVMMLSRFKFTATIPRKLSFEPVTVTLAPKGGLPMKIERRKRRWKIVLVSVLLLRYIMFVYTLALFATLLFLGLKYIYSYWDRHGVHHLKPEIPYGNLRTLAEKKESFGIAINNLYHRSTERLVGVYLFFRPAILIRDAHLAKRIMVNDFQSFHDRGVYCEEQRDPISANLFALPGQRWKNLRARLTPTFTSGQLRNMMPTLMDVGKKLLDHMKTLADDKPVVDMRDVSSRFVLDIIASVFFGFDANCINNSEDPFLTTLKLAVRRGNFVDNIRSAGVFICPGLLKLTGLTSLPSELVKFVTEIITYQIDHREKNQTSRKDFVQLLIDLRREASKTGEESLTIEQCAANVFLFYIAGAETSTATISFTLHELTHNPAAMSKLQAEIDETLERHNGEITYENIKEMKYLDLCVKETLRKYPGLPILNRECTIDYRVPDSDTVIHKGTQVVIPLLGISMNEKYFPDPETYSPERFDEATKNYDPEAYFPFGVGPRNCIGLRQGVLVSKIGLVLMLSKFNFVATVPAKVKFAVATVPLAPKRGLPMRIERRK
uniref:Cytochrome P450 n=1 Tax=Anopheles dirus TaxID=7168 RepID=A0A182NFE2_9DIPT